MNSSTPLRTQESQHRLDVRRQAFARALLASAFALLTALSFSRPLWAQDTVILTDEEDRYPLGLHLSLLEDESGTLTVGDVTSAEYADQFVPSGRETPSFGFTKSTYWVRFTVANEASAMANWLLEFAGNPFFIDLYVPAADGEGYQSIRTGSARPYDTRHVDHPRYLFDLLLPTGGERTVYLRVQTEAAFSIPLVLWQPAALAQRYSTEQLISGFLYGVLLIMVAYNLILFLYLRDRSYLYYVLFLGLTLISYLWNDNYAHKYLWSGQGRFNAVAGQLFFVLGMMAMLKFTTSFLQTKEHVPRLNRLINILVIGFAILIPIQFVSLVLTSRPVLLATTVSYIIVITAGILVWRRGYQPARYFVLAWVLWLTSILVYVLSLFDLLPLKLFAEIGSGLSLIVLVLMLSLALADRISHFRQEAADAQMQALHQQEAFNRALQVANESLEARVEERSHELEYAQDVIGTIFENSPLGIGFAGTDDQVMTANPSLARIFGYTQEEFVTLNVKDLFPSEAERIEVTHSLEDNKLIQRQMQRLRRKDGSFFFANLTETRVATANGDVVLGVVDDMTDLIEAEEALHAEREEVAILEERGRIAADMHDSATQTLYSALLFSQTSRRLFEQGDHEGADYYSGRVSEVVQQALKEIRLLIFELRPEALEAGELVGALQQRLDSVESRAGVEARLIADELPPLSNHMNVSLYRIALEALNNAMRHARANAVTVRLASDNAGLMLKITDDGIGFDVDEVQGLGGLGLANMRERAMKIGATLTIESSPHTGTTIRTEIKDLAT